ncbi:MAG: hypothetical protein LH660_22560 [Phormidesmis sp. CAN_BIN36]|nr:hypothetical protein [Phormidesmis sp. CAN_BIN36]
MVSTIVRSDWIGLKALPAIVGLLVIAPPAIALQVPVGAIAQTSSQCQPPNSGEYLLLVVSKTSDVQDKLRKVLPTTANTTVCRYLDDRVIRVSGFNTVEIASSWAQYLTETVGLQAFVARPAIGNTPQTTIAAPPSVGASTGALKYNPQPLGVGYAVLVSYFSKPELATQLQQALKKDVGLVSYGQRPYLLATYTTNQSTANSMLQSLSDRGFVVMVVDSRRVTLLKANVQTSPAAVGER